MEFPSQFSRRRSSPARARREPCRRRALPSLEVLEDRTVPSTLVVSNLLDSGPGSLREALTLAANPGADGITFAVAGTINVLSPLPALRDPGTTGGTALPNVVGLFLNDAPNNVIGTNADGVNDDRERNVISGNAEDGVE